MDLVVSTPTVALNPQQGAALPALRAGDVIEAQVLQAAGDAAKIAIGNTILEVLTQIALTPGSTVKLAVSNTPQGLRLTLVGHGANGAGNAGAAGGAGNGTTAAAGQSATAAMLGSGRANGTIAGAGNTTNPNTAASEAAATIVTTSAGAAQMAASAGENAPDGAPAAQPVTTGGSAGTATATSVATAAAAAHPQGAAQPPAPNPILAATAALAAAVQSSAARQGGLGPLFADAGVAAGLPAVPEPVRQAAERLLALLPALDETISADGVKQALDRSGLFLEARLATAAGGTPSAAPESGDDLKAALVVLRGVLKSWLANDLPISTALDAAMQGSMPEAGALNGRGAFMGPMPGSDPGAPDGSDADVPNAVPRMAVSGTATTPPPPYRGAPTAGQPAAAPSISADTAPRDIGRVLLNETDAALARQTLLQAASLPDHASAANAATMRTDPTSGPRWLFEVPFATPQGAAVAQFEIARDGHNAPPAGQKVAWRARFSLDVEPIGPVHAQIALVGTRAAVTLWAERSETSTQLRANAPALADALRQAELDPGDVLVRAGTPPRPREAAPAGRFLDRAS